MAKRVRCLVCNNTTFSIRYMTKRIWGKPKGKPQWCKKCDIYWINGKRR